MVEPAENFAITDVAVDMINLQKELVKIRKEELVALAKSAKPRGSKMIIPAIISEGKDFIKIIRVVQKEGFELVVKASGKPHLTGMLFSTLDMNLVRKCPCPVLIMKPRKKISHSKYWLRLIYASKTRLTGTWTVLLWNWPVLWHHCKKDISMFCMPGMLLPRNA